MNGPLEASVTLEDIFLVVHAKRVPLAPELAGYLALEIAGGADGPGGDIDPRCVYVGEEGSVALVRPRRDTPKGDAETSVRHLLSQLLDASGSQTPALSGVARNPAGGGLSILVQELEEALIPVNRAAGRRALARLAREVKRVTLGVGRNASIPPSERGARGSSPVIPPPRASEPTIERTETTSNRPPMASPVFDSEEVPTTARREIPREILDAAVHSQSEAITARAAASTPSSREPQASSKKDEVDQLLSSFEVSEHRGEKAVARDLKAMAGLEPTPPPPTSANPDAGIEALLMMSAAPDGTRTSTAQSPNVQPKPRARSVSYADDRQLPTAPSQIRRAISSPGNMMSAVRGRHAGGLVALLAIIVLGVIAAGLWLLKPGFFTGRTPEKLAQEKASAEANRARTVAAEKSFTCKATLVVSDAPNNAEVLLRVGQAPVDAERMPAATRLEFVATLPGYAPKRAVIPAGAPWDASVTGKPRFELAVQLDRARGKPSALESWPPGEPGSDVGGKGVAGTVHVVSSPKGAEIWLLAGVGPEATIEQLGCNSDIDVLVAGPTSYRKRLHVRASDFVPQLSSSANATTLSPVDAPHVAKISAK